MINAHANLLAVLTGFRRRVLHAKSNEYWCKCSKQKWIDGLK